MTGSVNAVLFVIEVTGPVGVQITVADHGVGLQDRLGPGRSVAHQVTDSAFVRAGDDRPPLLEGVVVMQVLAVAVTGRPIMGLLIMVYLKQQMQLPLRVTLERNQARLMFADGEANQRYEARDEDTGELHATVGHSTDDELITIELPSRRLPAVIKEMITQSAGEYPVTVEVSTRWQKGEDVDGSTDIAAIEFPGRTASYGLAYDTRDGDWVGILSFTFSDDELVQIQLLDPDNALPKAVREAFGD